MKTKVDCRYYATCVNAQKCNKCPGYYWHTEAEVKAFKAANFKRFHRPTTEKKNTVKE